MISIQRFIRTIGAIVFAAVLASSGLAAQQGVHGVSAQAGAPVVGTLRVDTISEAPTPLFGLSFSVVNVPSDTGGGGGAGKAVFSEFKVARQADAASPLLFKAAATGVHLTKVQIDVFRSGTSIVENSYILTDVVIASFGTDAVFERVAFSYAKIEFLSGGAGTCFNPVANAGC
jgi:Type VI secretion system effector, Hcp